MSKIQEICFCGVCNNSVKRTPGYGDDGKVYCGKLKRDVGITSMPQDCPLPDYDAWKKELLEWIEKESEKYYPVNPDETRKIAIVNNLRMVKQKIQEM